MGVTVEYLGLKTSEAAVFERATVQAAGEIQQASRARDEAVFASPADVGDEGGALKNREIQHRYEQAKREILGRLNSTLGESQLANTPELNRIRVRLEEWINTVR